MSSMAEGSNLKVVPLLCPDCGRSLPAGEHDVIFHCAACDLALEIEEGRLARRELLHFAGQGDVRLPFWLLPFRVDTVEGSVRSVREYRLLAGTMDTGGNAERSGPPLLFVPACSFATTPLHVRAGRLLTLKQPVFAVDRSKPVRIEPIVFREADALTMGESILLATVTVERKKNRLFLEGFSCSFGRGRLATIPFADRGGKLYHAGMNLEL
jgi:hypothetical protein